MENGNLDVDDLKDGDTVYSDSAASGEVKEDEKPAEEEVKESEEKPDENSDEEEIEEEVERPAEEEAEEKVEKEVEESDEKPVEKITGKGGATMPSTKVNKGDTYALEIPPGYKPKSGSVSITMVSSEGTEIDANLSIMKI